MKMLCLGLVLTLGVGTFLGCKRHPDAERIVRLEIPAGKVERAKARAQARRQKRLAQKGELSAQMTQDGNPGDVIFFCAAVAVTAPDLLASDVSQRSECNFNGKADPSNNNIVGQPVDLDLGLFFGLLSTGEGPETVGSDGFTIDDGSSDDEVFVTEIAVTPGSQRQFNLMIFDINQTQTGFTSCEGFLSGGGRMRLLTDTRNGSNGHLTLGANFAQATADVGEGVTEVIIEDGTSEDTEIAECCGPLFNEPCSAF